MLKWARRRGGVKNLRVVICTRPLTAKARVAEHYTNRGFSVSISSAPEKVDGPLISFFSRSSDVDSSKSPLASRPLAHSLERVRGRASRSPSGVVRWFLRRVWMHWGGVLFRFHFATAFVSYTEPHEHQFRGDLR